MDLTQLRQVLTTRFNEEELRDLCFDLQQSDPAFFDLDYENFPDSGKAGKVRELLLYFERRSRLDALIEMVKRLRPDIVWSERVEPGSPVARPTASDGLYLSRLINPQRRGAGDVVSTVWITARGPRQYYLDSVRIKDYGWGIAGPVYGVAMPPDAEYRFTYGSSERTEALNPALSIGPETRQSASFTLSTAPDEPSYLLMGHLRIWIRYHTSDGRTGTLVLEEEPPAYGRRLAQLLGTDVRIAISEGQGYEFSEAVVSPLGLQRGLEPDDAPPFYYIPVELPEWTWSPYSGPTREAILAARAECRRSLRCREQLNRALQRGDHLPTINEWLAEDARFAADLLGGIIDPGSTEMLVEMLRGDPLNETALYGLCVRHLAAKDDLLAAHVLAQRDRFMVERDALKQVMTTLALEPAEGWGEVMMLLAQLEPEFVPVILGALHEELPDTTRLQLLDTPGGPFGAEMYVRGTMHGWATPPPEETKLHYRRDGFYQVTLWLEASVHEFKIADAYWRSATDWGAGDSDGRVVLDRPFGMRNHSMYPPNNLVLDLTGQDAGRYTFTVDARDPLNPTVTVSREK